MHIIKKTEKRLSDPFLSNGKKIDDKSIDDKNTVNGAAPASDHNKNIDDKKITSGAAPLHVIMYDETPEEGECVGP